MPSFKFLNLAFFDIQRRSLQASGRHASRFSVISAISAFDSDARLTSGLPPRRAHGHSEDDRLVVPDAPPVQSISVNSHERIGQSVARLRDV